MALATRALPLASLMLLLLQRAPGVGAQVGTLQLQQPQDKVLVTAGETFTLTCTISGSGPVGPVKWLKGWGSRNEIIYDQTGTFPRVKRAVDGSNTDFTIHIRDVRPEDSGTYYCVKFRKTLHGGSEVFQHGNGTEVSVRAKPTPPIVSGPSHRAGPGQSVSVTCTAGGFFPKDISVKWFKDKTLISAQQPQITPGQTSSSYKMSSTVMVMLQEGDVHSWLVCEVQHATLTAPLRGTYKLSNALRVSPRVHVVADPPSPIEVNKTLNFTCHVEGFYPEKVSVTWLENRTMMNTEILSRPVKTSQGLFELRSTVEVQATQERNGSVFTCRVVHDAQDPVSGTAALRIAAPAGEGLSDWFQTDNGVNLLSSPGLWLGILLEKGLLGGLLIFLFKRARA